MLGLDCEQCVAGLLHCQATPDNPGQSDGRLPDSPDISLLSPELQQEWSVDRNRHLGPIKVKLQSSFKAVWECNKCPAGQLHIWTAIVSSRCRGSKCPYCSNRLACLHNSLATIAPDQVQYWNRSKNEATPEQVLAGSQLRAEWRCPTCKWEWQARIAARMRRRAGCPKCLMNRRTHPTFAEAQPAALAEWDYRRNDAKDIFPDNTSLGSGKPSQFRAGVAMLGCSQP